MPGHEKVERAFLRIGVAHETAARADGVKTVEAARDELVGIDLMAGVPNEPIFREVESQVQSQA